MLEALLPPMTGGGRPGLVTTFNEKVVMVLAPHPDDEALGCGGSLLQHSAAGSQIIIVHLTDGRLGDGRLAQLDVSDRAAAQNSLIELRRLEALACAKELRATTCLFLDAEDGALSPDPALVQQVANLLNQYQPNLVYLPFAWDSHEDHWQTNRIACATLALLPQHLQARLLIRAYEVWSPLPANRIVDISADVEGKAQLIAHYASQLIDTNYLKFILNLNAYRALMLPQRGGYAEAFFECNTSHYVEMVKRMEEG
jgi:LmbE family N-acetylglucosaminyl deacetylase